MLLAMVHVIFPRYFNWKEELRALSLINRQMMKVHTFFIALTVFLMGLLCFTSSQELIETSLGRKIAFGLALFWTIRLVIQVLVYSPKLWKGKIFETIVHVVFTVFWTYLSLLFLVVAIEK